MQIPSVVFRYLVVLLLLLVAAGCEPAPGRRVTAPASGPRADRVVSLSPAATDLLVAMGATSRLVGVSNYDWLEEVAALPRTGDYLSIDWEKLSTLRPQLLIVQVDESRLSDLTRTKAREMGVELLNIRLNNFTDVVIESERLGNALGMAEQSRAMWQAMRQKMDDVRLSTAPLLKVRTLVTLDEKGLFVAGRGTFVNDLLQAAGGENVLSADRGDYVTLDEEGLGALAPEAVLMLVPKKDAKAAQVHREAFVRRFAEVPAVKNDRVYLLADPRALTPGSHLAEVANWMADQLHPGRSPAARPQGAR